jgi:DNA-binding HxlR family transcriptional regulator
MENMTIEDQSIPPCDASNNNVAEFDAALHMLTGKWKGDILYRLVQHKHRFGELKRSIPGITQHMLTAQLRELEADGLVRRTVFAEVPPRVEYEVTEAALALRPVFDELFRWITQYGGGLRRARVSTVHDRVGKESARPV